MKILKGDLIKLAKEGHFDVIVHGCNCHHTMGAGIAKTIKEQFPGAYAADKLTTKGSYSKLGDYSIHYENEPMRLWIINAYTQYNFSRDRRDVSYDAIANVFAKIKRNFNGSRIGYPMIGAGLAGGDWDIISNIIDIQLKGENHTLVKFVPKR